MSEATTEVSETVDETSVDTSTEAEPTSNGEQALGDAGKKALDAMKAERKAAREEAAAVKAERDALQAKLDGREAEYTQAQERAAVEKAALVKANDRILKSEVKAAAKGVLADPQDAYKFLDLDSFEVDVDGNVDETAIADALADLIERKPYLSAQGGKRFQGTADGGARNDVAKVTQLTESDMNRMSPEQIADAHDKGQFDDLLKQT